MRLAVVATGAVLVLLGEAVAYVAWAGDVLPRVPLSAVAAAAGVIGGAAAIALTLASRRTAGVLALAATVLVVEVWYFTALTGAVEKTRTLKPFCLEAASRLRGVPDDSVALYGTGSLDLVFYLNRGALRQLGSPGDLEAFMAAHPDGYVFAEYGPRSEGALAPPAESPTRQSRYGDGAARLAPVLVQRAELPTRLSEGEADRSPALALMRFGAPPGSQESTGDIAPQRP
jgi:hypothetical protein